MIPWYPIKCNDKNDKIRAIVNLIHAACINYVNKNTGPVEFKAMKSTVVLKIGVHWCYAVYR